MKITLLILLQFAIVASAQQLDIDSLKRELLITKQDTSRAILLAALSNQYVYSNPDSVFLLGQQGLKIAQSINYTKGEIKCKQSIAQYWWLVGDYTTAIKLNYTILEYAKAQNDTLLILFTYGNLANNYRDEGDYKEALHMMFQITPTIHRYKDCWGCGIYNANIGSVYYGLNMFDSALFYLDKAVTY